MSTKPFKEPICVKRPFLPPIEEFRHALGELWHNAWLTNAGPVVRRFAAQLAGYLESDNLRLFNNGSQALTLGLRALGLRGEVITTPFTFVATTHAISANGLWPVFVDIEPTHFTIDPRRVEAAITPKTSAIVAVHVYGHPCNVRDLAAIAARYRLTLVYDAAHAFGVRAFGRSIACYGDLSMFSFHATKLFHTMEGGAVTFPDGRYTPVLDHLTNHGFEGETEVAMVGTNAKMTEMQALMGTLVLPYVDSIVARCRHLTAVYRERLDGIPGIHMAAPLPDCVKHNYSYLPVQVFEEQFGISRDLLYERLKSYNVFARRYFYPLVCDFACYRDRSLIDPLTVARGVADRILCLPIYPDLPSHDVEAICAIVREIHKSNSRRSNAVPVSGVKDYASQLRSEV